MDAFVEAIKNNDLVKAKKAFGSIMTERTTALIESRKKELAAQVMIEGEAVDYDQDEIEKTGVTDPDADAAKDKKEREAKKEKSGE